MPLNLAQAFKVTIVLIEIQAVAHSHTINHHQDKDSDIQANSSLKTMACLEELRQTHLMNNPLEVLAKTFHRREDTILTKKFLLKKGPALLTTASNRPLITTSKMKLDINHREEKLLQDQWGDLMVVTEGTTLLLQSLLTITAGQELEGTAGNSNSRANHDLRTIIIEVVMNMKMRFQSR